MSFLAIRRILKIGFALLALFSIGLSNSYAKEISCCSPGGETVVIINSSKWEFKPGDNFPF